MIRMIQSRAAGHAKAYFSDALSKSDYYVSDQELPGFWQGRLAARLGLSGPTAKEDFFALCENRNPLSGQSLTPRTKDGRRVGYDINFHCPKSVSILHALAGGDGHILKAFRDSVSATMREMEAEGKAYVRKDGASGKREAGEWVWAHFVHQTARPVEGFLPDPHLHSHCFVFNAVWDEAEQRIKAGEFGDIKRDMPWYQARFHKTLADKLTALGYAARVTDTSFEIAGVPQGVIDLFSKRTDEIGRMAREKGVTDPAALADLGARTRGKKQKGTGMAELTAAWREQIAALGPEGQPDASAPPLRHALVKPGPQVTAQECLTYALSHRFERASVVDGRRILETAYRQSIGKPDVTLQEIDALFSADKNIIHVTEKGRRLCTTREVLAEEKRMVELARQGQFAMRPLYDKPPPLNLDGQQAAAVEHVLTTPHRVSIIRGAAGTGKTTLMKEAIAKMEEAGKRVTVVAPSAQAARGVLRSEGFDKANTVARLLVDQDMQKKLHNQVLWVDEAGLLGTREMTALLDVTARQKARLILGGDTRQHASVVRGDALRILNTVAGIDVAEVSKIYRQKNENYRAAVGDLSKGDVKSGFEKLDAMGAVKEVDPENIAGAITRDYMAAVKAGKSALVISPTHAQGDEVTGEIRQQMRAAKMLGQKEIGARRLVNLNLTEAEKSDARHFAAGQIVQFNQNAKGFTRGSQWTVAHTEGQTVHLQNDTGDMKELPLQQSRRYDVYREQEINLSKGDKVRITRNGFDEDDKRLDNGDTLDVASVSKKGKVTLRNPVSQATYTIGQDFGHIAHAHCITSHAAQGKTVDEVFIYQPAGTFPATDAKQFYVSVSRGREQAHIYTDDKEELLRHASDQSERQSALELVGKDNHLDAVIQMQRDEASQDKIPSKDYDDEFDR